MIAATSGRPDEPRARQRRRPARPDVGGRVALSPDHLSADGSAFRFERQLYMLDEDRVLTFRGES